MPDEHYDPALAERYRMADEALAWLVSFFNSTPKDRDDMPPPRRYSTTWARAGAVGERPATAIAVRLCCGATSSFAVANFHHLVCRQQPQLGGPLRSRHVGTRDLGQVSDAKRREQPPRSISRGGSPLSGFIACGVRQGRHSRCAVGTPQGRSGRFDATPG
jgi:hypothetical protein